ncbi:MAG: hypothetical protein U0625_09590 [Phycisphaerales bacterium]
MRLLQLLPVLLLSLLAAPAWGQGCGSAAAGSCLEAHTTPGCSDADCCSTVCQFAPECCQFLWDSSCASLANQLCVGLCGAAVNGDCRTSHTTAGCDDAACCSAVCAIDPACCEIEWDTVCVLEANKLCEPPPPVPCGDPSAGSCSTVHSTPSCSDLTCCNTVCSVDPSCCIQSWDALCVAFAGQYCVACSLSCPIDSIAEAESCGSRTNDPCAGAGQAAVTLAFSTTVCGQLNGTYLSNVWSGDRDLYAVTVADPDGDGLAKITLRLSAEFPAFAALVPRDCGFALLGATLHVNTGNCIETIASLCVPPGQYWVVVVPGTFPTVGLTDHLDCTSTPRYTLRVEQTQSGCAPPCSASSPPCFASHPEPGCNDVACCQSVCAQDPFCCSDNWDVGCAQRAVALCGGTLAANDNCAGALPLHIGETLTFDTILATVSTPALPSSCDQGTGALIGSDVWYFYDPTRSGNIVVSTCGSATNLRVAVYTGQCGSLTMVACNSSSVLCSPSTGARLQWQATCGTRYYIRVGGENTAEAGPGQVKLEGQGPLCPVPCPADLNADGMVNGADIGLLLGNWGNSGVGDVTGDGIVNGADIGALLGAWGACP